jgi:hypothetical protein
MEFRPPCMVFSTIGLSQPGKLSGTNTKVSLRTFSSLYIAAAVCSQLYCLLYFVYHHLYSSTPPATFVFRGAVLLLSTGSDILVKYTEAAAKKYCSDAESDHCLQMPGLVDPVLRPAVVWPRSSNLCFQTRPTYVFFCTYISNSSSDL